MKAHPQYPTAVFDLRNTKALDDSIEAATHETCSYCGSLNIETFIRAFQTTGTEYSGADWKYGWPHKFYIDIPCEPYQSCVHATYKDGKYQSFDYRIATRRHYKFYTEHMIDATPQQMLLWKLWVEPKLGVKLELTEEKGLMWYARGNYQSHGTI